MSRIVATARGDGAKGARVGARRSMEVDLGCERHCGGVENGVKR
jgi:hypothetical protein